METKDRIRREALKLFSRRGYAAVGIQEVAEASGITKPSLYHHFGSKAGLFDEILEFHYTPFLSVLSSRASYAGDLAATLNAVFTAFIDEAGSEPDFLRLKLSLDFIPNESEVHTSSERWNQKIYGLIEKIFISAAKDHGNMKGRHGIYSASFIGLCHTYASMYLNGHFTPGEKVNRDAVKYFMHGIFS